MKKEYFCAVAAWLLVLIAAGFCETIPVISVLCVIAMAVCVWIGELWEAEFPEEEVEEQSKQYWKTENNERSGPRDQK